MNNYIVLFAFILLSFSLTFFVRRWAIKKAIIDHPNERSSHNIATPRGGGIAIAVSWFLGLIYFKITNQIDSNLFLALISGLPLAIVGLLDDIISLKPNIRFLIQFVCAGLALFFLSGLNKVDIGFYVFDYKWILLPIALIGIVWAINLFNFLDGIDGYISTEVIFIGTTVFVIYGDIIALLLAVCVLGFLFWNWQKAKIFMGDVCSTLLGFNVAVFAIFYQNQNKSSILVWLILTSVFWFDATITLLRRIKNRENLGQAHRKHAFQRIVQAGFSHQKTVISALLLNIIGLVFVLASLNQPKQLIFFLIADTIFLFVVLKLIDRKKPFEYNN